MNSLQHLLRHLLFFLSPPFLFLPFFPCLSSSFSPSSLPFFPQVFAWLDFFWNKSNSTQGWILSSQNLIPFSFLVLELTSSSPIFHLGKWQHKLSKMKLEFSILHMEICVDVFPLEIRNFMFYTCKKLGAIFLHELNQCFWFTFSNNSSCFIIPSSFIFVVFYFTSIHIYLLLSWGFFFKPCILKTFFAIFFGNIFYLQCGVSNVYQSYWVMQIHIYYFLDSFPL